MKKKYNIVDFTNTKSTISYDVWSSDDNIFVIYKTDEDLFLPYVLDEFNGYSFIDYKAISLEDTVQEINAIIKSGVINFYTSEDFRKKYIRMKKNQIKSKKRKRKIDNILKLLK